MTIALLTVAGTIVGIVVGAVVSRRNADEAWLREQRLHTFAATAAGVATITSAAWLIAHRPSDEHFYTLGRVSSSVLGCRYSLEARRVCHATKRILGDLWSTINAA